MTITVLISGRGSNMQALHRASVSGLLDADITHVIANKENAAGLTYAKENNIATSVVDHTKFASADEFDRQLLHTIESQSPRLVLLAGFMRRLGAEFTQHFESRLLNIHPSLLPRYPGLNTHSKALDNGDKWHGCSVHFVTAELDAGPLIARSVVPATPADTPDTLAARVLEKEHRIYWRVAQLCLQESIIWQNGHVDYCGNRLIYPLTLE
jgi:phosphoribosylglycinamide formyltransferase-1